MNIEKNTVEIYRIRDIENGGWADITIDASENTGRVSIASSHGSWERYWGSCGCPFKEFLCHLDICYAASKFGSDNHFNLKATIKSWKEYVLQVRRDDDINEDEARELYSEIKRIEAESPGLEGVKYMLWNSELLNFFDYSPCIVIEINPAFVFFWDKIWKPFTEELKKETLEPSLT